MAFNPYKTIEDTAVAAFSDGGDDKPVNELTVEIAAIQSGTGDPSSENVRPIAGFSGISLFADGKNLLSKSIVISTGSDAVTVPGQLLKAGTYTIFATITGATLWRWGLKIYDVFGNNVDEESIRTVYKPTSPTLSWNSARKIWGQGANNSNSNLTFTLPRDCSVRCVLWQGDISESTETNSEILILGSTVSDYEEYVGHETSIVFPESVGTVYGGTLNVITGDLTITHANIASYNGEEINKPWISSMDVYDPDGTPSTGAQVVYPLTTPESKKLTPQQVKTLLGINRIYVDSGKIQKLVYVYHYIQLEKEEDEMKSGYVMIDCGGLDLTGGSTPQTLSGLYARIKEAMGTGKLTLAENCINGSGVKISPLPVAAYNVSSTKAGLLFGTLLIEVTNADSATVTDLTSGG